MGAQVETPAPTIVRPVFGRAVVRVPLERATLYTEVDGSPKRSRNIQNASPEKANAQPWARPVRPGRVKDWRSAPVVLSSCAILGVVVPKFADGRNPQSCASPVPVSSGQPLLIIPSRLTVRAGKLMIPRSAIPLPTLLVGPPAMNSVSAVIMGWLVEKPMPKTAKADWLTGNKVAVQAALRTSTLKSSPVV